MTQFDGRTTLAWDVVQEVRRNYADKVFQTLSQYRSQHPSQGVQRVEVAKPLLEQAGCINRNDLEAALWKSEQEKRAVRQALRW